MQTPAQSHVSQQRLLRTPARSHASQQRLLRKREKPGSVPDTAPAYAAGAFFD